MASATDSIPEEYDINSWQHRLKLVIGPHGYVSYMRRSLQTCILYEAKRIIQPRHDMLRPKQRKFAFMDQAQALLDSLDFIPSHEKEEVFYRTMSSKETVKPDVAWGRAQLIDRELEFLAQQVKPFYALDRTHEQAVDLLVHDMFAKQSGRDKLLPKHWEHAHRHYIMTFRLYYRFDQFNPAFPPAILQKPLNFPTGKLGRPYGVNVLSTVVKVPSANTGSLLSPMAQAQQSTLSVSATQAQQSTVSMPAAQTERPGSMLPLLVPTTRKQVPRKLPSKCNIPIAPKPGVEPPVNVPLPVMNLPPPIMNQQVAETKPQPADDRRQILAEVREHLELLKEFEGAVSPEDLAERKRQLFLALPPAPPPANDLKRQRL